MAVNILIENNFLIVDEGTVNAEYFNASFSGMDFSDEAVIITDFSKGGFAGKSITIKFTDFEYGSVAYTTKTTIATVLSDKIG